MRNIWHCIISKSNIQHNKNKNVSLISLYEFTFAENDSQLEHSTLIKLCQVWIIFSTAVLPVKARCLQSEPAPASLPSTHPSLFFTRETCWLLKWPWSCYNVAVMVSSAKSVCFELFHLFCGSSSFVFWGLYCVYVFKTYPISLTETPTEPSEYTFPNIIGKGSD